MYKEEQLRGQFMDSAGRLKREPVTAYQRHVEPVQELLSVLMHYAVVSQPEHRELLGIR